VTFHSLDFVVFFLVVVTLYWRLGHRHQNLLLVAASYVFYGYVHPWFLSLIFATTVIDYWAARGMDVMPERRRLFMGLSLAANLGMLGFFKYFNFFADNVHAALSVLALDVSRPALSIVLPVGISFYTFQELSYTIEVYRGTLAARCKFLDFAAFVCFFPQLVAGPIERATRLLPQVEGERRFSWAAARSATILIVWGYFQKLVVADNVGVVANKVFALKEPGFHVLWAGVFAFGIQIYADFSAYSDIARGTARWLGFDIVRNFYHPYLSRGPTEFWHRWHISLSSWFRDYVYIPLGGSRGSTPRRAFNVLATFILSGLWHGASWNYVVWGFFHGLLLVGARALAPLTPRGKLWTGVAAPFQVAAMFVLVNVGWLMFRETETAALLRDFTLSPFHATPLERQTGLYLFLLAALYSVPLWMHAAWELAARERFAAWAVPARIASPHRVAIEAAACGLLVAMILVFRSRTSLDFIYFQF
jgi:D-alanyl-lipoteichoic acid acyltransferase DltB (MBOAT superfamily)